MRRITLFAATLLFLTACSRGGPAAPAQGTASSGAPRAAVTLIEPAVDPAKVDIPAVLAKSCQELTAEPIGMRVAYLHAFTQALTPTALDLILGPKCTFLGAAKEVVQIGVADLLPSVKSREALYYIPDAQRYFVSFTPLRTVGYIVPAPNVGDDTLLYYDGHLDDFRNAAKSVIRTMKNVDDTEILRRMSAAGAITVALSGSTTKLSGDCDDLRALSTNEKVSLLQEIAQNMDEHALGLILGARCKLFDDLVLIGDTRREAMQIRTSQAERVFFSPSLNYYLITYSPLDTVGYIVLREDPDTEAAQYFDDHLSDFDTAAGKARALLDVSGRAAKEVVAEKEPPFVQEAGSAEAGSGTVVPEPVAAAGGSYVNAMQDVTLVTAAIGKGQKELLFFFAAWCSFCQAKDALFTKLYSEGSYPLSTYKVDFDTAADLKERYKIDAQDTVILLDGSGSALEIVAGASEEKLKEMLSGK